MGQDQTTANVDRSHSLGGTNIAIFTFMLFFLYPRAENGTICPWLFQTTLVAMGVTTFSFVFAALEYYRSSVVGALSDAERAMHARRADRFWVLGFTGMFLAPSLVLFLLELIAVAWAWLSLWLVYLLFVVRFFPKVQTPRTPR
jgi:hypothetical protein